MFGRRIKCSLCGRFRNPSLDLCRCQEPVVGEPLGSSSDSEHDEGEGRNSALATGALPSVPPLPPPGPDAENPAPSGAAVEPNATIEVPQPAVASQPSRRLVKCVNCCREGSRCRLDSWRPIDNRDSFDKYANLYIRAVKASLVKTRRRFCLCTSEVRQALHSRTAEPSVLMCWQCKMAVFSTNIALDPEYCWPAFIRSILESPALRVAHGTGLWELIPGLWRSWWLTFAKGLNGLTHVTHDDPAPKILDITSDISDAKRILRDLKWDELTELMDDHCCYPEIKCPWGCSEFLVNAGDGVPIDAVLDENLGGFCLPLTFTPRGKWKFLPGIMPDFLESAHPTLCNANWMCTPCLAFSSKHGPSFVTCRHHSRRTRGLYVHVPPNPLGPISSPFSDQLSPVVIQPRTLKTAQRKQYSDSYQVVRMNGSFEGVDSATLRQVGRFDKTDFVSEAQDRLSLSGRPDVVCHMACQVADERLPEELYTAKLEQASAAYTADQLSAVTAACGRHGTYIALKDAVAKENDIKKRGMVLVRQGMGSTGQDTLSHFRASWPRTIVFTHPIGGHGSRFPVVTYPRRKPGDNREILWLVRALIVSVPSLWTQVSDMVKNKTDWYGWLLHSTAKQCLPFRCNDTAQGSNPFRKVKTEVELCEILGQGQDDLYDAQTLFDIFGGVNGVAVLPASCDGAALDSVMASGTINTLIFVNTTNGSDAQTSPAFAVPLLQSAGMIGRKWELRSVVCIDRAFDSPSSRWKGIIHCRHGGIAHPNWWRQQDAKNLQYAQFRQKPIFEPTTDSWDACVYVSESNTMLSDLQKSYWDLLGCQNRFRCSDHEECLIRSPRHGTNVCFVVGCGSSANLQCPRALCRAGVCKVHAVDSDVATHSEEDVIFVPCLPEEEEDRTDDVRVVREMDLVCRPVDTNESSQSSIDHLSLNDSAYGGSIGTFEDDESVGSEVGPIDDDSDSRSTNSSKHNSPGLRISGDSDEYHPIQLDVMFEDQEWAEEVELAHESVDSFLSSISQSSDNSPGESSFSAEQTRPFQQVPSGENSARRNANITYGYDAFFESHNDSYGGSAEDADDDVIPSTNPGLPHFLIDADDTIANLHVLMNKVQRLLVRTRHDFKLKDNERHFIERLVSTSNNHSIPLVYPEAMLFPSIFWKLLGDGSVLGAMPGFLLNDNATLTSHGFASLYDHIRTRFTNTALLTSTDYKWIYMAMDFCLNLCLRGTDTRLILSRGFGEQIGGGGLRVIPEKEAHEFMSDSIDKRPMVNKLAAALGERKGSIFYTHTCNMKDHVGMRVLKEWIDSPQAIDACLRLFGMDPLHVGEAVRLQAAARLSASACSVAVRAWSVITKIWMRYIFKSPEKPIGPLDDYFMKQELQEAAAQLCHLHIILFHAWDDGTTEGRDRIVSMIRGSVDSIVTPEEYEMYLRKGILSSKEHLLQLLEMLEKILTHHHNRRCLIPRKVGDAGHTGRKVRIAPSAGSQHLQEEERFLHYRCKVPDNRLISSNPTRHVFVYVDVRHTPDVIDILEKIGSVVRVAGVARLSDLERYENLEYVDKELETRRHVPPTSAAEGIISPVLSRLVVINPNSDNAQYLDNYGVSQYLAKYVASIDECNRIFLRAPTDAKNQQEVPPLRAAGEKVGNTKITSIGIIEGARKKKTKSAYLGRASNQTEGCQVLMQEPQTITTFEFVHISTTVLEERPAVDRTRPIQQLFKDRVVNGPVNNAYDINASQTIPSYQVRSSWTSCPDFRKFQSTSLLLARDVMLSPLSTDAITAFGIRPPELSMIRSPVLYHRCFVRESISLPKTDNPSHAILSYCHSVLDQDYFRCAWVDASNRRVRLRLSCISRVLEYIEAKSATYFGNSEEQKSMVVRFFRTLLRLSKDSLSEYGVSRRNTQKWNFMRDHFLCCLDRPKHVPVIWFTSVRPSFTGRFLIHILLSMGEFHDEMQLMQGGSIKEAFVTAGLIVRGDEETSVRKMLRRYVVEQLCHLPGGAKSFDRHLVSANRGIREMVFNDAVAADGTPSYLYTHLVAEKEKKVEDELLRRKKVLIDVVQTELRANGLRDLPNSESVLNSRTNQQNHPVEWSAADIPKSSEQSIESYEEQQNAIRVALVSITQYCSVGTVAPKAVAIIGDPGAGKTTVSMFLLHHALCLGLNCATTAVMGERATQLGGVHLHDLFCLPGRTGKEMPSGQIAEIALSRMYARNQVKVEVLRRLDVLLLDEMGQLSAELLTVLDIILRRLRSSMHFMGGVLLIATMDVLQLLPIVGHPPMLSSHCLTSFRFVRLEHSVRAFFDADFCRIQKITRMFPHEITEEVKAEFLDLFQRVFTFIDSLDDTTPDGDSSAAPGSIPRTATYVFAKKKPALDVQTKVVKRLIREDREYRRKVARDEEATSEGNWMDAAEPTVQALDRCCREPKELYFVRGTLYTATYNDPKKRFNQSQLCYLKDLPSQEQIDSGSPILVYFSPAGKKDTPPENASVDWLQQNGWYPGRVGFAPEQAHLIKQRFRARRYQYGLKMRLSGTIHSCMGQTLSVQVSQVSRTDPAYLMWERAQVVVILSRTKRGKDTIFVGDPMESALACLECLLRVSQYHQYIRHLLDNLVETGTHQVAPSYVDTRIHPYRAIDISLPVEGAGVVYMLVSTVDQSTVYVGQTLYLSQRLNQHNSGSGSTQTRSEFLRPWALFAYICGFDTGKDERLAVESEWKTAVLALSPHALLDEKATAAAIAMERYHSRFPDRKRLVFVRCGFFE